MADDNFMGFFNIDPADKVHVFIDGANFLGMLRQIEFDMDYKKLNHFFQNEFRLVRSSYFAPVHADNEEKTSKVLYMIECSGFNVQRKFVRDERNDGAIHFRTNVIPEMTAEIVKVAAQGKIDHIIVISGDGELAASVRAAQDCGVRVTVVGHKNTASSELVKTADGFIEISTFPDDLQRD